MIAQKVFQQFFAQKSEKYLIKKILSFFFKEKKFFTKFLDTINEIIGDMY